MFTTVDPHRHLNKVVEAGHCVRLVQDACGAPLTAQWQRGRQVRGGNVARGTAIATFGPGGRYMNAVNGSSHAAIFLEETADGFRAWISGPVNRCMNA